MVAEAIPCGPELEPHLEKIREYEDAGFDELYIQQVGGGHERLFELYAEHVLPQFGAGQASDSAKAPAHA
jgi:hypothetical protein